MNSLVRRVDRLLLSKSRLRFVGNWMLMVSALFVLLLFLLFQKQEETINKVGSWVASAYKHSYAKDRKKAMVWAGSGDVHAVIKMLEQHDWQLVQLGDRSYPFKRELLLTLCEQLRLTQRYDELNAWAGIWRKLEKRNVTALAYWYESLRHLSGGSQEGRRGLQREWARFPLNSHLTEFYAATLYESGDIQTARTILNQNGQAKATASLTGWQIHFGRYARELLPSYLDEFLYQLKVMDWPAVGGAWQRLWREATNSKVRRSRRKQRKMVAVNLQSNVEGLFSAVVEVPANITRFKIVPPPVIGLSITDMQLSMAGRVYNIPTSVVTVRGMVNHDGGVRVINSEPSVWFPLPAAARRAETETVSAELLFKITLARLMDHKRLSTSGSQSQ